MKASWSGSRWPARPSPSIVMTDFPEASKARYVQALTGSPSTKTVQAPQTWDSHDRFVPVRRSRSRTNSSRVSSTRTSPRHGWPLISKATGSVCHVCGIVDCVCTASAISLPPVGTHGLGQCPAQEHPCQISLVRNRSVEVIDRLQDLFVVALRLPHDPLTLHERGALQA